MTSSKRYWVGKPDSGFPMTELPSVNAGTGYQVTRGEQQHDLLGGGLTMVRGPYGKRVWALARDWMEQDELSLLRDIYMGLYVPGPYRFRDPSELNLLGQEPSTFGRAAQDLSFWKATSCASAIDTADLTRPAIQSANACNVVKLSGLSAASVYKGDPAYKSWMRIPRFTGQTYAFGLWVKASLAANVQARLVVQDDALHAGVRSAAVAVGTGWQKLVVSPVADSAFAGGGPTLIAGVEVTAASGAVTLSLVAPMFEIRDDGGSGDYQSSLGVGNVVFAAGVSGSIPRTGYRSLATSVAEI